MDGCHIGQGNFKGPDLPSHGESQLVERKEVNAQRDAEMRSIEKTKNTCGIQVLGFGSS